MNFESVINLYKGSAKLKLKYEQLSVKDRRDLIIKYAKEGVSTVAFLSEKANVTSATIRLDIIHLINIGKIKDISPFSNARLVVSNED